MSTGGGRPFGNGGEISLSTWLGLGLWSRNRSRVRRSPGEEVEHGSSSTGSILTVVCWGGIFEAGSLNAGSLRPRKYAAKQSRIGSCNGTIGFFSLNQQTTAKDTLQDPHEASASDGGMMGGTHDHR